MITRVRIAGFKSLGDVTVDLGPLTVLIGRSGTGKSNFIEALCFLRDYVARPDAVSSQYASASDRLFCATSSHPRQVAIEVVFRLPGTSGDFRYLIGLRQAPPGQPPSLAEELLSLDGTVLFHRRDLNWVTPPDVHSPPEPSWGLTLGTVAGVQDITTAYFALTIGLGHYDFPETVFLAPAVPTAQARGLSDHGENYLDVFATLRTNLSAPSPWKEITAALRRLNPAVKNIDFRLPQRDGISLSHQVGNGAFTFDLQQESEGLRRFFAHLLALYQMPSKQTLLFEEPEKGIHPGALAVLAEEFKACVETKRGQVILTTHSPELLNYFEPEQLRVTEIHDHLTRIGPVVSDQLESLREHLLTPGELLTVDPARLTTPPVPVG